MVVGPFFCGAVPPNSFPTKYLPFTPHIQDNWSSQTLIRHYKEGRGGPNWAVRGGGQVIFHDLGGRDLLSKVYHSIRETFAILYYGTGCLRNAVLQSAGLFLRFPPQGTYLNIIFYASISKRNMRPNMLYSSLTGTNLIHFTVLQIFYPMYTRE